MIGIFLFLALGTIIVTNAEAQSKQKRDLVKLFQLCKDNDHRGAADYIVYRGSDETRKWKDTYDYDNETERYQVEQTCGRISSYLELAPDFVFREFKKDKESEGTWHIWEVLFGNKKVYFALLKIKGRYCLGDID
jgi:hypothetical protein